MADQSPRHLDEYHLHQRNSMVQGRLSKYKLKSMTREQKWNDKFMKPFQGISTFVDHRSEIVKFGEEAVDRRDSKQEKLHVDVIVEDSIGTPGSPYLTPQGGRTSRIWSRELHKDEQFSQRNESVKSLMRFDFASVNVQQRRDAEIKLYIDFLTRKLQTFEFLEEQAPFYRQLLQILEKEYDSELRKQELISTIPQVPASDLTPRGRASSRKIVKIGEMVPHLAPVKGTEELFDKLQHFQWSTDRVLKQIRHLRAQIFGRNQADKLFAGTMRAGWQTAKFYMNAKLLPLQEHLKVRVARERVEDVKENKLKTPKKKVFMVTGGISQSNKSMKSSQLMSTQYSGMKYSMISSRINTEETGLRASAAPKLKAVNQEEVGQFKTTLSTLFERMKWVDAEGKGLKNQMDAGEVTKEKDKMDQLQYKFDLLHTPESLVFTEDDRREYDADRIRANIRRTRATTRKAVFFNKHNWHADFD